MKARSIHLIGICGTAMASLAGMLKARGLDVRGSDSAAYPPMSTFLESLGIPVLQPFSERNLIPAPDLVVVGNAISRGNPELEYLLDQRLPFVSMPEVIHQEFIRGHNSLVIAGTHGKTTTTSMAAWIFEFAGRNPSFLVGGIAENFGSSFAVTDGKEFIIEGDEYDTAFFDKGPKFLHYFPDSVILTSVEFDHADIYRDLEAVKFAFKRLVNLVPRRGRIIAWDGSPNVSECVERAFCSVERYGFHPDSFWRIEDVQYGGASTRWTVLRDGQHFAEFEFALAGEYNVLNATAAAALAHSYGIPAETIARALRGFLSVKRRLEVRAEIGGITIIDDFAHHPTAIARHPGRAAQALRRTPPVGDSGAALQYAAAQCLSARIDREPGPGRSGCDRQRLLQNHGRTQAGRTAGCGQRSRRTQRPRRCRTATPRCCGDREQRRSATCIGRCGGDSFQWRIRRHL